MDYMHAMANERSVGRKVVHVGVWTTHEPIPKINAFTTSSSVMVYVTFLCSTTQGSKLGFMNAQREPAITAPRFICSWGVSYRESVRNVVALFRIAVHEPAWAASIDP